MNQKYCTRVVPPVVPACAKIIDRRRSLSPVKNKMSQMKGHRLIWMAKTYFSNMQTVFDASLVLNKTSREEISTWYQSLVLSSMNYHVTILKISSTFQLHNNAVHS
jgi:hypothetical protein